MSGIAEFRKYLPARISDAVSLLPQGISQTASELRLRAGMPASVTVGERNLLFDTSGRACGGANALRATRAELLECVSKLTRGSLYSCENAVSMGYIPLPEGGRAGVCGRAKVSAGRVECFSEITSVNLRVHRFVPDFAAPLAEYYRENGVCGAVVFSPPARGKTTFLRSAAYMLSCGVGIPRKRVGIADEREEIVTPETRLGIADALIGSPKGEAIELLTRTMSPEIIICDEIGESECESVLAAQNSGVSLIASAHAGSVRELLSRRGIKRLIDNGVFGVGVMLGAGYTAEITELEA